jgi:hypothetical protein
MLSLRAKRSNLGSLEINTLQKENINPLLVKLRQIEASLRAIEKWDGHLPRVTSGSVPFIDVKSFDKE